MQNQISVDWIGKSKKKVALGSITVVVVYHSYKVLQNKRGSNRMHFNMVEVGVTVDCIARILSDCQQVEVMNNSFR